MRDYFDRECKLGDLVAGTYKTCIFMNNIGLLIGENRIFKLGKNDKPLQSMVDGVMSLEDKLYIKELSDIKNKLTREYYKYNIEGMEYQEKLESCKLNIGGVYTAKNKKPYVYMFNMQITEDVSLGDEGRFVELPENIYVYGSYRDLALGAYNNRYAKEIRKEQGILTKEVKEFVKTAKVIVKTEKIICGITSELTYRASWRNNYESIPLTLEDRGIYLKIGYRHPLDLYLSSKPLLEESESIIKGISYVDYHAIKANFIVYDRELNRHSMHLRLVTNQ